MHRDCACLENDGSVAMTVTSTGACTGAEQHFARVRSTSRPARPAVHFSSMMLKPARPPGCTLVIDDAGARPAARLYTCHR